MRFPTSRRRDNAVATPSPVSAASNASARAGRQAYWIVAPRYVAWMLAAWCALPLNLALWCKLASLDDFADPWMTQRAGMVVLIACAMYLWFMLWSWPAMRRLAWSVTLVLAAVVQYCMLHYGMVMDSGMVHNVLHTNFTEAAALFSPYLLGQVLLLAGVPVLWLYGGVRWPASPGRSSWIISGLLVLMSLSLLVGGGVAMYRQLAPLLRNHGEIRFQINPLATVVSVVDVTLKPLWKRQRPFRSITTGATLGHSYTAGATSHKPPLLVLVVGETARADHFGLNGYPRNTTPVLEAHHVLSWRHVQSCGTNTLASVPCMFSHLDKPGYESRPFEYGNLLDVLQAAGLAVDWLDNQAGCKGVCERISHAQADQVASAQAVAQWCREGECLDQLMVELLDQRLQSLPDLARKQGVVLVLHQMGSHGPAYHRRSSASTKQFQPECTTQVTSDCSHAELVNVYDNSMRETDLFMGRVIEWLQTQQSHYATGMLYVSDHGESLGENGFYLHGLPYVIAPEVQKHVPWVLWPGSLKERMALDVACASAHVEQPLTHDSYYHTVLGMLDVQTPTYQSSLDILAACRNHPQG